MNIKINYPERIFKYYNVLFFYIPKFPSLEASPVDINAEFEEMMRRMR